MSPNGYEVRTHAIHQKWLLDDIKTNDQQSNKPKIENKKKTARGDLPLAEFGQCR